MPYLHAWGCGLHGSPTKAKVASRIEPWHHLAWPPGQARIAAEGGADRRSAEERGRADGSIARSAPCGVAAPFPRRAATRADTATMGGRGTRPLCVGCCGIAGAAAVGEPSPLARAHRPRPQAVGGCLARRGRDSESGTITDSGCWRAPGPEVAASLWAMGSQGVAAVLGVPADRVAMWVAVRRSHCKQRPCDRATDQR
jgi:hypothetical protein